VMMMWFCKSRDDRERFRTRRKEWLFVLNG
jgi:hypothetical protein